jgi:hypothetical protein
VGCQGEGRGEGVCVEDWENAPGANLRTVAFAHFLNDLDVSPMFLSKKESFIVNVLCW